MRHILEPRRLPETLRGEELVRSLQATGSVLYQAALGVAYGAGLRASEVAHFKVINIDSKRLGIKNSVMHDRETDTCDQSNASISLFHEVFVRMLTADLGLRETLAFDELSVDASVVDLTRLFTRFEAPSDVFTIVTP